jgi:hypothetical protein
LGRERGRFAAFRNAVPEPIKLDRSEQRASSRRWRASYISCFEASIASVLTERTQRTRVYRQRQLRHRTSGEGQPPRGSPSEA